jgi:hypothetical protein
MEFILAIGVICCALTFLKAYTTSRATIWIVVHGEDHVLYVDSIEHAQAKDYLESFRRNGGYFWPFGVKEHVFLLWLEKIEPEHPQLALVAKIFMRALFSYPILAILGPLYVYLVSILLVGQSSHPNALVFILGTTAIAAILMNIAILIEQVAGNLVLQDYGKYFHMLPNAGTAAKLISQAKILFISVTGIILSGSAATFVGLTLLNSFSTDGIPNTLILNKLVNSLYFVTTTLSTTGYGDIHPTGYFGIGLASVLHLVTFFFVTFVVTSTISVHASNDKHRDVAPSRCIGHHTLCTP